MTETTAAKFVQLRDVAHKFSGVQEWARSLPSPIGCPEFASIVWDDEAYELLVKRLVDRSVGDAQRITFLETLRSWVLTAATLAGAYAARGSCSPGAYAGNAQDWFLDRRGRLPTRRLVAEAPARLIWAAVQEQMLATAESLAHNARALGSDGTLGCAR